MPERDPAERLDELIDAMRAGRGTAHDDRELTALLEVAMDLTTLPRDDFRDRLGLSLVPNLRTDFHTITPYLQNERVEELLEFLSRAFGAVETLRAGTGRGLHLEVRIGDSMVMMGGYPGMPARPQSLHLYVENADVVYEQALAAGATSLHPLVDQPYGDREGGVRDPFGNQWYIATHMVAPATGHRPAGLRTVTPYFHPHGAAGLIDFLKSAFAAEEVQREVTQEGTVQHAKVRIGDSMVEMGEAHGPWQPTPAALYMYVEGVDDLYARALAAGATSLRPPGDEPYGDRTAHVEDAFGNIWYLATPMA